MSILNGVNFGINNTTENFANYPANATNSDSAEPENPAINDTTQISANDSEGGINSLSLAPVTNGLSNIRDGIAEWREEVVDGVTEWVFENTPLGHLSPEACAERLENVHDNLTEIGWDKEVGENENGDRSASYTKEIDGKEYTVIIEPGEQGAAKMFQIHEDGEEIYNCKNNDNDLTEEEREEYYDEARDLVTRDLDETDARATDIWGIFEQIFGT